MRRYKGTFDIFFGIEHRLRKDEMEEQLNKEAKEGWRFAADAARITDERADSPVIWEQLLERKKEQSRPSQRTKAELSRSG